MPNTQETDRARKVLDHANSSVANFFKTFDAVRKKPGGGRAGAPTDEQQDLLRAALVFSAAGLDSSLKELVRGSLRSLGERDPAVRSEFEVFVQRQLKGETEELENLSGFKLLASVLVAPKPQDELLNAYVIHLTGSSLQSVDQLVKTAKALGVSTESLVKKKRKLNDIFQARNKIIHEMDIKFVGARGHRQRNSRTRTGLKDYADELLQIADTIIAEVEDKLSASTA